ncbi:hypothetical protein CCHL11_10056 [Colletotrichum chlorophyti]|uniref:Rhodopsin domain-containing protein n=1 Tax=Colletotrichum chlorophyti TaxID=708187 RepID=A0A1Q8RFJ3_9PEZI|nr:hypothetical protein CCHL11_10056 [Colletotrichum chlorophyti]
MLCTFKRIIGYFAYYAGGNINVKLQQVDLLSNKDVRILKIDSKMEFVTWYTYPAFVWVALIATVSSIYSPFHNNWTVHPLPSEQCTFRAQNFYVLAVLNVITDAFILIIPVPMLWHLCKRVSATCLLCGGLFIIAAAIIRAALTLTAAPSVLTINIWGYRETVIALLAVTAPVLSPLFRPGF